jgi:hypothetical protein
MTTDEARRVVAQHLVSWAVGEVDMPALPFTDEDMAAIAALADEMTPNPDEAAFRAAWDVLAGRVEGE